MEQRTLRLGDVVDDYCPRERRVTNHAIVAIVGDAIRQTRCTTCDADHVYKGGREPKRRKKDSTDALYGQVLSEVTGQLVTPRGAAADAPAESLPDEAAPEPASPPSAGAAPSAPALAARAAEPDDPEDATSDSEPNGNQAWWPGHRQLIRATLPRTEADPPPVRPIPEFTMHQRQSRGRGFGHGHGWGGHGNQPGNGNHANGNHFGNGNRNGNAWSGRPGPPGGGHAPGPGQPREGGGRGRRRHRHRSNKPR